MMDNIKPNSHKYNEDQKNLPAEKKVEKVVTGKVTTKKKSGVRKLSDVIISEDASNVGSHIFMEVIVPAIQNTIVDVVTDTVTMIFGKGRSGKRSSSEKVSYRDYARSYDRRSSREPAYRSRFDCDELIFETRGDAEAVLDQMDAIIERYGVVTVADMYDMADRTAPYTSNRYGWTSLRTADIVRVREGYIIKISRPMPID